MECFQLPITCARCKLMETQNCGSSGFTTMIPVSQGRVLYAELCHAFKIGLLEEVKRERWNVTM